jgi:hypothetical protein
VPLEPPLPPEPPDPLGLDEQPAAVTAATATAAANHSDFR